MLIGALTGVMTASAQPLATDPDAVVALLKYPGPGWNPRPHALTRLLYELQQRTSVEPHMNIPQVDVTSAEVFRYPLLVLTGDRAFAPLTHDALRALSRHLQNGGMLWIDNNEGRADGGFDASVRALVAAILPGEQLRAIPRSQVLFNTFYIVRQVGGRIQGRADIEGVLLGHRLAVIYSGNDLAGAFERDEFGNWVYRIEGGDMQREMAFRLGINIIMYALCLDYKDDQVHLPFILKRRR
jgi:hypothetical protein